MSIPEFAVVVDSSNFVSINRKWCDTSALRVELAQGNFQYYVNIMAGKPVTPKRSQWGLADAGISVQRYSRTAIPMVGWTPEIGSIRDRVVRETGLYFDSCLVNYYRDGSEFISPHGDRENLGPGQPVATVSVGASRRFRMFTKSSPRQVVLDTILHDGDAMLMFGPRIQTEYHHEVPPQKQIAEGRYSLTFRIIDPSRLAAQGIVMHPTHFDFTHSRFVTDFIDPRQGRR